MGFLSRVAAPALVLSGCSFLLGPFDQCKVDADCSKIDSTDYLVCLKNVCVEPCTRQVGTVGQPNTILFGALLPFTAPGVSDAGFEETPDDRGPVRMNAIDLAASEINQRQGIGGRTFGVTVCDTFNDAATAQKEAGYLIGQGVPAIISSASDETIAAATDTVSAGVLLISVSATDPEITTLAASPKGVRLVWRTAPSDVIQAKVIANVLSSDQPPWTNLATLYSNEPYGQDLYGEFSNDYSGMKSSFPFPPGGDVTSAVGQANALSPDIVLVVALSNDPKSIMDAASAASNLSRLHGKSWFFTDGAENQALIDSFKDEAMVEGCRGTAPAAPAGTLWDNFRASYMAAYNIDPAGYSYVANSYDAFYCLALASAWAAGTQGAGPITGQGLGQGMGQLSSGTAFDLSPDDFTPARSSLQSGTSININGVSGPLDFDSTTGEAPASIELWTVDGGQIEQLAIYPPP
jgi:branched-chain amino acid transport system substrate-binding protein